MCLLSLGFIKLYKPFFKWVYLKLIVTHLPSFHSCVCGGNMLYLPLNLLALCGEILLYVYLPLILPAVCGLKWFGSSDEQYNTVP